MLIEILVLLAAIGYWFYRWAVANNDFFKNRGIPYKKPSFILGNMKEFTFRKKPFFDMTLDAYKENDEKVYGFFEQRTPLTVIKDPNMIKQITIKDFDHFVNHRSIFADESNDIFGNGLFSIKDGKWKDMRSTLTPVFTTAKLRQMFQLMNEVAQNTVGYLQKQAAANSTRDLELDVKDYSTRFTNDIIATTAFGIHVNSFENKENEFYMMGKKVTTFGLLQNLKFLLIITMKKLMKLLDVTLIDKTQAQYFTRLVLDAMKYRKDHNIFRPDMIQMLMEARGMVPTDHPKTHNREWTDSDIVAQCFIFFFAGFETSSVLICCALHELMENPEVQQKLFEEIQNVELQLDGEPLTYESLQGMKYLDMVLSETLRKWPPAVATDRMCNKDIVYEYDNKRLEINAGHIVQLPIVGLHRDPKYFENPDQFDPERFSEENKANIQPFTYFPFGLGPRNCIGNRFALLEVKALIYYIVREFRIEAASKTTRPMKLSTKSFQIIPLTGFWLKFSLRKET